MSSHLSPRPMLAVASTTLALMLGGCSWIGGSSNVPLGKDAAPYNYGSVTGDDNGIILFGSSSKRAASTGEAGIGVNSYLWRASLDSIAFMPLVSADPFGGVLITDWYAVPDSPSERFKLTIYILNRDLRADGVKVSVFRQTRDSSGTWSDAAVNPKTAVDLENAILTRARQMRLQTASQ